MNTENIDKKNFKDYIKSNQKIIITILVVIFLIICLFLWFDHSKKNKRIEISENYIEAKVFLINKNFNSSFEILKNIIYQKDIIYSPLSLFLIIDQDLEKDKNLVSKYFDEVLSIKRLNQEDLNLLKLKKAIYIAEGINEKELLDLLNPIINSESVWKIQSIKFLADFYFEKKEFNKAEQYYSKLLNDKDNLNIDKNDIERKLKLIKK